MTRPATTGRHQFQLRSVLAAITWLALVLAVCVQHQRTSARQREVREHLMSDGFPPLFPMTASPLNGRPKKVWPSKRPTLPPSGLDPSDWNYDADLSTLPST
jgi:hypothetical protein